MGLPAEREREGKTMRSRETMAALEEKADRLEMKIAMLEDEVRRLREHLPEDEDKRPKAESAKAAAGRKTARK